MTRNKYGKLPEITLEKLSRSEYYLLTPKQKKERRKLQRRLHKRKRDRSEEKDLKYISLIRSFVARKRWK